MAITLNKEQYTPQQIEAAEPLIRAIEKYDRQIAQQNSGIDPINESFEKAKQRRDTIARIETKKKEVQKQLEDILDMRNRYDEMFVIAQRAVGDLQIIKERWGF